jgi:molybdopterin converting factor small subunit
MTISVQLFAQARDLAGAPRLDVPLSDGATVAELKVALVRARPVLERIERSLLVSVNGEYAPDGVRLSMTDEVACFPPVSGG